MSAEYVEQFRSRVLQDAFAEASARYWRRRAQQFREVLPRPEDFPGKASPEVRGARRRRILAIVEACEMKAQVIERYGVDALAAEDVEQILRESA